MGSSKATDSLDAEGNGGEPKSFAFRDLDRLQAACDLRAISTKNTAPKPAAAGLSSGNVIRITSPRISCVPKMHATTQSFGQPRSGSPASKPRAEKPTPGILEISEEYQFAVCPRGHRR